MLLNPITDSSGLCSFFFPENFSCLFTHYVLCVQAHPFLNHYLSGDYSSYGIRGCCRDSLVCADYSDLHTSLHALEHITIFFLFRLHRCSIKKYRTTWLSTFLLGFVGPSILGISFARAQFSIVFLMCSLKCIICPTI